MTNLIKFSGVQAHTTPILGAPFSPALFNAWYCRSNSADEQNDLTQFPRYGCYTVMCYTVMFVTLPSPWSYV